MNYLEAVTIVNFLVQKQGKSVEEAITEAEVPEEVKEQVREYFRPPLEILSPEVIAADQVLERCNPTGKGDYFEALRAYLIDRRRRSKAVVDSLEDVSLQLVRQLPKPDAADRFDVRGLVVGHVQSGKTAAMAALMARAADEGYRLFIVLGGAWKDLRAQTQKRLDQEITGTSDDPGDGPFVEHPESADPWVRLTTSGLEGDFRGGPSDLSLFPKLAVIKKNNRIDTLISFLKAAPLGLENLPALIIDDESDQGSIDTNANRTDGDGEPLDPTATNRRIRALLNELPKSVYVGFTATPFANVLIDATAGDDLYPKDFIITLPEPPAYVGTKKLFGLGMTPSDLSGTAPFRPAVNLIRNMSDEQAEELARVARSSGNCPEVLSDAILGFVLSCCARLEREQGSEHFSMLVHTTQYTEPHRTLGAAIGEQLLLLREAAARPDRFGEVCDRARRMWENDFMHVSSQLDGPVHDFESVWKHAKELTDSIEIKVINQGSSDQLEYRGHPKRYIVVGGNRLSRGLTLEGLSISVFSRSSNQYDTLLQMGRWFGYRPGYLDLTRIYVDAQLETRFADLARIEEELRADLSKYAADPNLTPLQLKPLIRRHPAMAVTGRMKYGAGRTFNISFARTTQQTVSFPVGSPDLLERNIESSRSFVASLSGLPTESGRLRLWSDVPAAQVLSLLNSYEFSGEAREVNRANLTRYIEQQNSRGELVTWDVVLPGGNSRLGEFKWADGVSTNKVIRTPILPTSIGVLRDPADVRAWRHLSGHDESDPTRGCLMFYVIDKDSDIKEDIKFFPDRARARDLVGLTLVFPESESNETIEYVSQP